MLLALTTRRWSHAAGGRHNDGHLRNGWGAAGLLEFGFADDTGCDYQTCDEVAEDRAAATA